jgi:phosphatidylinositol glycan class B
MRKFFSIPSYSRNTFLIACAVYLFTAYNSIGFYHADEHYQILEFANMKLGDSPANELPWEYNAQIRPVAQVSFAMVTISFLKLISITNPYTQVFVLRCITAFLMLLIISFFIKKTRHFFKDPKKEKIYITLSYFLWFLPFLSVRFSSEIWSGMFFLLMITLYLEKDEIKRNVFLIGIIAGLSFLFRFQIVFALFGFFIWAIFIKKESKDFFLKSLASFILVIVLGFLLDSWFYEDFVFTPFNYFYENIVNNKSENYGVSPWYYYLEKVIRTPTLIVGIPLFISLILFFIKNPKNMFTWILVSFIVFHSLIGHKEERFMFPMIYFLPLILSLIYSKYIHDRKPKRVIHGSMILFFLFNFFLAFLMGTKGTDRGRLVIAKHVYDNYKGKEIDLIHTKEAYLFHDPSGSLTMNFYNQKNLNILEVENICEISRLLKDSQKEKLVVIQFGDLKSNTCLNIENATFLKESLPLKKEWLIEINNKGANFSKFDKMLLLYKFD